MNREQYEALNTSERAVATEAYIDGYLSAIAVLESAVQRTGDELVDKLFIANRNSLVHILKSATPHD